MEMDDHPPGFPASHSASSGTVLHGHFLTRNEASRLVHLRPADIAALPGLVRLNGLLGEVYPAFQFTPDGRCIDALEWVVERLTGFAPGERLASWLAEPQPGLGNRTPLSWLQDGRPPVAVLEAADVVFVRVA